MDLGETTLFTIITLIWFAYLFFIQSIQLIFLFISMKSVNQYKRLIRSSQYLLKYEKNMLPPVTVIVPAHNEAATIVENIKGFLRINYDRYEVIVVNDGSKDDTLVVLQNAFDLFPLQKNYSRKIGTKPVRQTFYSAMHSNLTVVDKENGGKADAINAAINMSQAPYFCVVDADSILERDALLRIMLPFVEDRKHLVGVGGIVRIANGCTIKNGSVHKIRVPKNRWARMQIIEYLRGFTFGRLPWSEWNSLLIIAGAFSVFKKSAVVEIGGYLTGTVGEDMEITTRLHHERYKKKKPWRLKFIPDPVCWSQAPESLNILKSQRNRWQRGLIETLLRHKKMLMNPKFGRIGVFAFPYFIFVEILSPIFEVAGIVLLTIEAVFGLVNWQFYLLLLLGLIFYGQFVSATALMIEEMTFKRYKKIKDFLILFRFAWFEGLIFRSLNSWWKFIALFQLRKNKNNWGTMTRQSFTAERQTDLNR